MMSQITEDLERAFTQAENRVFLGESSMNFSAIDTTSTINIMQEQIDILKSRIDKLEKEANIGFKESL